MSNLIEQIASLVEEESSLVLSLERQTELLLYVPREDLEKTMNRRQELLEQLVTIKQVVKEACGAREDLLRLVNLDCDMAAIPQEEVPLFERLLAVRASINRTVKMEPEIRRRLEKERGAILKKIEAINSCGTAAAGKYCRLIPGGDKFTRNSKKFI